jgi:hypothetical protein
MTRIAEPLVRIVIAVGHVTPAPSDAPPHDYRARQPRNGGLAVDAMNKRVADMYVPGVDINGLAPVRDPDAATSHSPRSPIERLPRRVESEAFVGRSRR